MALQAATLFRNYSPHTCSAVVTDVCGVVVTYNPPGRFADNLKALASQVGHVVVVDNGSCGDPARRLERLKTNPRFTVIQNHRNLGIAAALNQGVRHALTAEFDWIITFDQDSRVSEGFVEAMLSAFYLAPHPENVALIAPSYMDQRTGVRVQCTRRSNGEIITAMTSGTMMPAATIRALGMFDESLFMDYVDTDFCLRARRQRMTIVQSPAILFHSLGRTTFHRFLGLRYGVTNHSWQRRYYITRNRLRLLMRYPTDWPWIWREIRALLLQAAKIVLVEQHKWKKFCAMANGALDAIIGRVGKQIEL